MIDNVNSDKCSGCGICVDVCPMDVFRMDEETKKTNAEYPEDCMTCYNCEIECPTGAIRIDPYRKERAQAW